MVSVNKKVEGISFDVKTNHNICRIRARGNSGEGKSVACSMIVDIMQSLGKRALYVDYRTIDVLDSLTKDTAYGLIVLDEMEQVGWDRIPECVIRSADDIWILDRRSNVFPYPEYTLSIKDNNVVMKEYRRGNI